MGKAIILVRDAESQSWQTASIIRSFRGVATQGFAEIMTPRPDVAVSSNVLFLLASPWQPEQSAMECTVALLPEGTMSGKAERRRRLNHTPNTVRPRLERLEARVVLSTFKVNTLLDTVAVDLKTGKDASGHIALRSAIQAANSRPNSDTIIYPAEQSL